jgi:Xaa-Pro aminopeptidase
VITTFIFIEIMRRNQMSEYQVKVPYDWTEREKWVELPFPEEEFVGRIRKLREGMEKEHLDAVVVYGGLNDPSNLRYLSNFENWWGENLLVVPYSGEPALCTNSIFHGEPMHSNVQTTWIRDVRPTLHPHSTLIPKNVAQVAAEVLAEQGLTNGRVGIVGDKTIPYSLYQQLIVGLPSAELVPATHLVGSMRRLKTAAEIKVLREAGRISDLGMEAAIKAVRVGATESEVAAEAYRVCVASGAERMNYGVMAASGPRSSLKNIQPLPKPILDGELVVIDIGLKYGGYTTDISRNVVAGEPTAELLHMLETCLEAEERVIDSIKPGVPIHDLQKLMFSIIQEAGLEEYDYTRVGFAHGYGLDIVEEPYLYWGNPNVLEPGMCFYVEPMIIKHGLGTVCIEDMIVVTENGCEQLSRASKRTW